MVEKITPEMVSEVFKRDRFEKFMFENIPAAIMAIDKEGQIVYVNSTFAESMGYAKSEIIGHQWSDLVHPEDLEASLQLANANVYQKTFVKGLGHFDNRYVTRDGGWIKLRWFEGKAMYYEDYYISFAIIIDSHA